VQPETTEAESASSVESKPQGDSEESEAADEQIVQDTKELAINEEDTKTTGKAEPIATKEDGEASSDEPAKDDMKEENVTVRRTRLDPPRTLETTMFDRLERMYGAGIKRLLAVQYR
jgi:DNA polymerase alpha-associated DNA helicase A